MRLERRLRLFGVPSRHDHRIGMLPKFMDNGRLRIHKLFLLDHGINASSCRRNFAQLVRAGNSKLDRLRNRPGRDCVTCSGRHASSPVIALPARH